MLLPRPTLGGIALGRLRLPALCLVTDRSACLGRPLEQVVAAAVEAGVGVVQLRERDLPARELFELGSRLKGPIHAAGALLVVNDRMDVAMAVGADGVHLGARSLTVAQARRLCGDAMLVGASAHSVQEALRAETEGADYVILGTIFETRSHPDVMPAGAKLVTEAAGALAIPVVAIGGVNAGNAPEVMAAGAAGVAVVTAIQSARDVAVATLELLRAMD